MRTVLSLVIPVERVGTLCLARSEHGICRLDLGISPEAWRERLRDEGLFGADDAGDGFSADPLLAEAAAQVTQYLAGQRQQFDLPLDLEAGTSFQHRVWMATAEIPFGQTRSYGQIARQIGTPGGARAVGGALGRNPVPIIVPCHRVLRGDGGLGGFGLGIETKRVLLALEGVNSPWFQRPL